MKKKNRVSREEFLALLERLEAQSLKEGDLSACNAQAGTQILKAVIEKTFTLRQLYWEGKMPSQDK